MATLNCQTGELCLFESLHTILVSTKNDMDYRATHGMGNKFVYNSNPIMKFEALYNDIETMMFYEWFKTDLDYGYNEFKIDAKYMGSTIPVLARFVDDIESKAIHSNYFKVSFMLEVVTNINLLLTRLESGAFSMPCDNTEDGNCDICTDDSAEMEGVCQ